MQNLASVHLDALDSLDRLEESGIRPRLDADSFIDRAQGSEPSPVYFELMGRRIFLGVLFPMGIIPAEDWERNMIAAEIPECLITFTYTWLAQRAL